MNQQELQAKQKYQEQQQKRIEALTLEAGAEMVKNVLPTMNGGTWDNYSLPEKIYLIYFAAERKAAEFIRNGGRFNNGTNISARGTKRNPVDVERQRSRQSNSYLPDGKRPSGNGTVCDTEINSLEKTIKDRGDVIVIH